MSILTREQAQKLDEADALGFTREEFMIPTKAEILSKSLPAARMLSPSLSHHNPNQQSPLTLLSAFADTAAYQAAAKAVYLVGNSLGLQPRRTRERISQYLETWRTQGVQGHFKPLDGSPLPTWLDVDDRAAHAVAPIVGARVSEVAVMQTLTANLHFLLCAFYKPRRDGRHKIILETKAFPSDHVGAPRRRKE